MKREDAWKAVRAKEKELIRLMRRRDEQDDPNFKLSYQIKINQLEEELFAMRKAARALPKDDS